MDESITTNREAAVLEPATAISTAKGQVESAALRIKIVWFALLLAACYWPTLAMTGKLLVNSDDMAHGFFAPIIALYVAWDKREVAFGGTLQPSRWGLGMLALAALPALAGTLGGSSTLSRMGFLVSLSGCILLIAGWRGLREMAFPVGLLLFTFPVPQTLYGDLTLPLQLTASRFAETALEMLGYSVVRNGNILELSHMQLSVVEACSGIRSLITLSFFCLVYAYFCEPRRWLQALIFSLAAPAAIFMNGMRVTMTGVLGKTHPELTHGTAHEILGWACFAIGFALVFLAHRSIRYFTYDRTN